MRIGIGGIMHESNTFVDSTTTLQDFEDGSVAVGHALIPVWKAAHHEVGGFFEGTEREAVEAVPTAMAWATPSGPVTDETFEVLLETLLNHCRSTHLDGLLLALHGAMVTPSFPDADGEVLRRLREALGPELPIFATLDYHGNVSELMVTQATALIGYQTYPHVDQRDRGILAARLLVRTLRGEITPVTAVAKPPIILNLLGQETDRAPMSQLLSEARDLENDPVILSVSVMAGFPYADVPEMGPSVLVVADSNQSEAQRSADRLGAAIESRRDQFDARGPAAAEAVSAAIASNVRPVVLVDLGDNIGGGTPGDGTLLLAELIRQHAMDAIVVLYDPPAVQAAIVVGQGGCFRGTVGGKSGGNYGPPIKVSGVVHSLHEGTWIEAEARHGGRRQNDQGKTAVLELEGRITVVLNSLRTPPFSLGQLTSLGLKPEEQSILVVKAAVAYKAAYVPIAGRVIEVDSPGFTAIDPRRFQYNRIRRPMFPLDRDC